jgi:hypothetical protein
MFAEAMAKTTNPEVLQDLAQRLSAVVARLDSRDTAKAAASLSQAMTKRTAPVALGSLARPLLAVADRLEPKDAAQVRSMAAATLIEAMTTTTNPGELQALAQGLSVLLGGEGATPRLQQLLNVAATVAATRNPSTLFATLAMTQLFPGSVPPPLPPQVLVDLLKHPFCVGQARRLLLEQLSRHYLHPFADQWGFVDYVYQRKLNLDLTTPPNRLGG